MRLPLGWRVPPVVERLPRQVLVLTRAVLGDSSRGLEGRTESVSLGVSFAKESKIVREEKYGTYPVHGRQRRGGIGLHGA